MILFGPLAEAKAGVTVLYPWHGYSTERVFDFAAWSSDTVCTVPPLSVGDENAN